MRLCRWLLLILLLRVLVLVLQQCLLLRPWCGSHAIEWIRHCRENLLPYRRGLGSEIEHHGRTARTIPETRIALLARVRRSLLGRMAAWEDIRLPTLVDWRGRSLWICWEHSWYAGWRWWIKCRVWYRYRYCWHCRHRWLREEYAEWWAEVERHWLRVINERLLLLMLMLLLLIILFRPLSRSTMVHLRLRNSSPSLQYLIIIQPGPHSTHHSLDLIARERPGSSPCAKLAGSVFARLRVH